MLTRMLWDIPAEAANVSLCRRAVRMLLEHNCISENDIDDTELVLGELCSNVVRHAYPSQAGRISVIVELRGLDMLMSVRDTGRGFDVGGLPSPPVFTESGGMGLFLMERLTDHLTIGTERLGGTEVSATRRLVNRRSGHIPDGESSVATSRN